MAVAMRFSTGKLVASHALSQIIVGAMPGTVEPYLTAGACAAHGTAALPNSPRQSH